MKETAKKVEENTKVIGKEEMVIKKRLIKLVKFFFSLIRSKNKITVEMILRKPRNVQWTINSMRVLSTI